MVLTTDQQGGITLVVRDRHLFFSTYIVPTVNNMHASYNMPKYYLTTEKAGA
jgi:hypothetical protein